MSTQDFLQGTVIDFDDDGQLHGARLGTEHTIAGIRFNKDTELIFDQSGEARIACLNSPHTIDGLECPAGTALTRSRRGTWHPLAH